MEADSLLLLGAGVAAAYFFLNTGNAAQETPQALGGGGATLPSVKLPQANVSDLFSAFRTGLEAGISKVPAEASKVLVIPQATQTPAIIMPQVSEMPEMPSVKIPKLPEIGMSPFDNIKEEIKNLGNRVREKIPQTPSVKAPDFAGAGLAALGTMQPPDVGTWFQSVGDFWTEKLLAAITGQEWQKSGTTLFKPVHGVEGKPSKEHVDTNMPKVLKPIYHEAAKRRAEYLNLENQLKRVPRVASTQTPHSVQVEKTQNLERMSYRRAERAAAPMSYRQTIFQKPKTPFLWKGVKTGSGFSWL